MRVIAGKYRGLRIDSPPGSGTRPITDRVKESLFSALCHRFGTPGVLPDLHVLDLFAGCGSFGIESLSRGAASCLFVERDRRMLRTLRDNVARLNHTGTVLACDNVWSMRFPKAPSPAGYDLIFVDPPYRHATQLARVAGLLDRLVARLAPQGLIVYRRELGTPLPETALPRLACEQERTWGRMCITWLTHSLQPPQSPSSP